jgi:hypothetical protein
LRLIRAIYAFAAADPFTKRPFLATFFRFRFANLATRGFRLRLAAVIRVPLTGG